MTLHSLEQLREREVSLQSGAPYYHYELIPISPDENGFRRWLWQLTLYDFGGGLNKQIGDFDRDYDRLSASTLDTRFPRTLVLPPLVTAQSTPDPTGTLPGLHWTQAFGTTLFAVGGDDNVSLFSETSTTNPAITAITTGGGDPGGDFTCAVPVYFNGSLKVVLGRESAVPIAITAANGTAYGTAAHTDLTGTYGIIPTFTNEGMALYYANGGIWTLRDTVNWSTQPVQADPLKSPMRAGGSAMGLFLLGGGLGWVRAYWREPEVAGVQHTTYGAERPFQIVSTDMEGNDKSLFSFKPQLNALYWSEFYRDGIVASDGRRLVWKNGAYTLDLEIFSDRKPNSDVEYLVRGGWVIGDSLKIRVVRKAVGASTGHWAIWEFDFEAFAWHQISNWHAISGGVAPLGVMSPGSLPWSQATGYLHHYIDGSWHRQFVPPANVNTFTLRKTLGAGAGTGMEYEASGTLETTAWELPGLAGTTKTWAGFTFLGDIEAGGTGASMVVSAAGQSRTIYPSTMDPGIPELVWVNPAPVFNRFQPSITLNRQSDGTDPTRYTPNGLPIMFWGYAFEDTGALNNPPTDRPRLGRR